MDILIPALVIGAIGLVLGALLAVASKIFAVEKDEKAEAITEVLPGANCGGCGFAGCGAYAEAISKGEAKISCCSPGGQAVSDSIAEIMGVSAEAVEEKVAVVLCKGSDENAENKYNYEGLEDCVAVSRLQGGGDKECSYGCMGHGSCAKVCSRNAISMVNGIAVVDREKCGGCGECAEICPKKVIRIVPKNSVYVVKCVSCDKGAAMKTKCSVGCIGCKICEKNCPTGAISVENNHAVIDYDKCIGCGICAQKCPKKIIVEVRENNEKPVETI